MSPEQVVAMTFLRSCQRHLGFLLSQFSFQPANLEMKPDIHFITVTFMATNVGVECAFDERERWVDISLIRPPTHGQPDSPGDRQTRGMARERLFTYLVRHGVRSYGLKPMPRGEDTPVDELFDYQLSSAASWLKQYCPDVLADSPSALDPSQ